MFCPYRAVKLQRRRKLATLSSPDSNSPGRKAEGRDDLFLGPESTGRMSVCRIEDAASMQDTSLLAVRTLNAGPTLSDGWTPEHVFS
jgi:hypothetical protein